MKLQKKKKKTLQSIIETNDSKDLLGQNFEEESGAFTTLSLMS